MHAQIYAWLCEDSIQISQSPTTDGLHDSIAPGSQCLLPGTTVHAPKSSECIHDMHMDQQNILYVKPGAYELPEGRGRSVRLP